MYGRSVSSAPEGKSIDPLHPLDNSWTFEPFGNISRTLAGELF
jgi:hypothetical protein